MKTPYTDVKWNTMMKDDGTFQAQKAITKGFITGRGKDWKNAVTTYEYVEFDNAEQAFELAQQIMEHLTWETLKESRKATEAAAEAKNQRVIAKLTAAAEAHRASVEAKQ